jgi:glycosyltransferase involved in cell wall biosynthesis
LKIAYVCHDSFPSSETNTQQIFWTLLEVATLGADVELTIPSVAAPSGAARTHIAKYYGAPMERLPETLRFRAVGTIPLRTSLARGRFDWRVASMLASQPQDLVWTRDALSAAVAARAGARVIFETYRPDFARAARFAPWRLMCLHRLAGVIVHSRLAADAFIAAGVPSERCLVAHNAFAPALMEPRLERGEARARLALPPSDPLVVYTGHLSLKKGIAALIALAEELPEARFLLLGADPGPQGAPGATEPLGPLPANVIVRPRVTVGEVAPYLYAADCLVVPPTDAPLRKHGRTVLPMKVFSYLAAGRPIVAPRLPDLEEVLVDDETVRFVPPGEYRTAAAALRALLADRGLQDRLGVNALAAAAPHTWQARAARIVNFLEAVLTRP